MDINQFLADIDEVKGIAKLLPEPGRDYALAGLEIAELVVEFLPEEQRQTALESFKAELRAGLRAGVQSELDASPGGRGGA